MSAGAESVPATYAAIDPLAPLCDGVYRDAMVEVRAHRLGPLERRPSVHTAHFDLLTPTGRVSLVHRVPPAHVDDDLAGLINEELFAPGWVRGGELFERIFTGVVRTSAAGPEESWELFYRNTLVKIVRSIAEPVGAGGHGTITDYAPVYAHAEGLVVGSTVLELGSCFGFLSLRLAAAGLQVTASDISAGTMRLLAQIAPALGVHLDVLPTDAARVEAPDRCADTVLAVHLLEHLDAAHGQRVLEEAIRLARRRVVIAVPLEEVADPAWGHLRTISLADLEAWGAGTGLSYDVHDHHGGWLVLSR